MFRFEGGILLLSYKGKTLMLISSYLALENADFWTCLRVFQIAVFSCSKSNFLLAFQIARWRKGRGIQGKSAGLAGWVSKHEHLPPGGLGVGGQGSI